MESCSHSNTYIDSYNHHADQGTEQFHRAPDALIVSLCSDSLLCPPGPATTDLFSDVIAFSWRTLYKWTHTVWNLLRLPSFTRNAFAIDPRCVYQEFIAVYCWVLFHCIDVPCFVYSFTRRTFLLFPGFGGYKQSYYMHICKFLSLEG